MEDKKTSKTTSAKSLAMVKAQQLGGGQWLVQMGRLKSENSAQKLRAGWAGVPASETRQRDGDMA